MTFLRWNDVECALSPNDCFALVLSEITQDPILFTGNARLQRLAQRKGIETHDVLWVLDQLAAEPTILDNLLCESISRFIDDPLVFLSKTELSNRLRKLSPTI